LGTILQDSQPQLPRGDVIGHGSYGSVSRALDVDNGFIFAVKKSTVPPVSLVGVSYFVESGGFTTHTIHVWYICPKFG